MTLSNKQIKQELKYARKHLMAAPEQWRPAVFGQMTYESHRLRYPFKVDRYLYWDGQYTAEGKSHRENSAGHKLLTGLKVSVMALGTALAPIAAALGAAG